MYIFLPVEVYDKCCNVAFSVEISNDNLVLNTNNEIKIYNNYFNPKSI